MLRELGLDVEKYYSSEIDKDAIWVQLHNFGDQIIHLGDVREVTSAVLDDMGEIHLLIGGFKTSHRMRKNLSQNYL
ncbi:DNA (cytosine-5)-methyltransferase 3A [Frankliniella fusca]|uniref:DNA (Cytosine-5)-methyltransferase 3A n=1 Tax=Frankliniella fusca TaxID=407009 RepID=A0AAE1HZY7_9NEOP|nr:DNA (cytosine-5)-methyltransferase 3A [Frankliniella fusca]